MSERCTCGDTSCPSCGTAQGTYVAKAEIPEITEDRYHEACNGYEGWCDVCGDFTRDCTEGDAEKYECPLCETTDSVCGAEQAALMGKFTIEDGDDE
jgi:hypothetical protein